MLGILSTVVFNFFISFRNSLLGLAILVYYPFKKSGKCRFLHLQIYIPVYNRYKIFLLLTFLLFNLIPSSLQYV